MNNQTLDSEEIARYLMGLFQKVYPNVEFTVDNDYGWEVKSNRDDKDYYNIVAYYCYNDEAWKILCIPSVGTDLLNEEEVLKLIRKVH